MTKKEFQRKTGRHCTKSQVRKALKEIKFNPNESSTEGAHTSQDVQYRHSHKECYALARNQGWDTLAEWIERRAERRGMHV